MGSAAWSQPLRRAFRTLAFFLIACAHGAALAASIRELRVLPLGPQDEQPDVTFTGIVTYAHASESVLILQDDTDAIWCPFSLKPRPAGLALGSRVEVTGAVRRGAFGNLFRIDRVRVLGQAALPTATPLAAADLLSGAYDCRLVETEGVIRAVVPWPNAQDTRAMIHLDSAGVRLRATVRAGLLARLVPLVDARVRLRGPCTLGVNASGQVLNAQVRVAEFSQVEVLEPPRAEDALPLMPLDRLLGFATGEVPRHRLRTRGIVSAVRRDEWVQIQDGARGVRVWTHTAPEQPEMGETVEVLGFAVPGPFTPQIEDGVFRSLAGEGGTIEPLALASATAALEHDGRLVRTQARLVEARTDVAPARLLFEAAGTLFAAELPFTVPRAELPARAAAVVEITGVCDVAVGKEWQDIGYPKPRSFILHLRNLSDLRVLRPAPWWTPARLAVALAAAIAALATALLAAHFLRRKNVALTVAETELRGARDALAHRVEVRTDQLQAQLAARRDEFAEFSAVTAERNRLARDLHDSLEQTLASAALRLDAADESLPADGAPELAPARSQITRAAELLRMSQVEVRRTVWGLRALALERRTLADALRESVRLLTEDTGLTVTLDLSDSDTGLDPAQESELLRVAQEAIANALKHAQATRLEVALVREAAQVTLRIADDGRGFTPGAMPAENGRPHYGLQDMGERAALLGAQLTVDATPGAGTRVVLRVPVGRILNFEC